MRQKSYKSDLSVVTSFNTASGMRSHVTAQAALESEGPWRFNTASGMRSHVTELFPPSQRQWLGFQYRKRYEITCDSVSGRPQKQKAQNAVLENLLKAEHAIAYFQLSLHTPRLCNNPAAPCMARLAAIRGKSENLPRFFASERLSTFHNVA